MTEPIIATPVAAGTGNLGLSFSQIYQEVSNFLGLGLSPTGANATLAKKYANDGYRMFLLGVDPRTERAHEWSFLYPCAQLTLTGDTAVHSLPGDYESMVDDPAYGPSDAYVKLLPRSVAYIRQLRAAGGSGTSAPAYYAVAPVGNSSGTLQTWQMLVWPTGGTGYTLNYRYRVSSKLMTGDSSYPLGGPQHHLTVQQAALAIAEQRENDTIGVQSQRFKEMMLASIDNDGANRPRNYGEMNDPSDNDGPLYNRRGEVTYS